MWRLWGICLPLKRREVFLHWFLNLNILWKSIVQLQVNDTKRSATPWWTPSFSYQRIYWFMFLVAVKMFCAENQRIDADKQIPSTGRLPNIPFRILIHLRNQAEDRKRATKKKKSIRDRGTTTDVILLVKITAFTINLFVSRPLQVVSEATPTFPHFSLFDGFAAGIMCTGRFSVCSMG